MKQRIISLNDTDTGLAEEVYERSGVDVRQCMQCGKCTGGCPMDFAYDLGVNQIVRMVLEDRREDLLACRSIWLCASCHTCSVRCPALLEVSEVLEVLRHMAREQGVVNEKSVKRFAEAFLASLAKYGRVHELDLVMRFNLTSGRLLNDAELGPAAFLNSKLHLRPPRVKGRDEVARIVKRFKASRASDTTTTEDA